MMILRDMKINDIQRSSEIIDQHPMFAIYGLTTERALSMLEGALTDGNIRVWVVEDVQESVITGFMIYQTAAVFARSDYIKLVAVDPRFRRQGVGRLLMEKAEAASKARGVDLFLLVNTDNKDAIKFYEEQGYLRIGRIEGYIQEGIDEYLYRKTFHQY